MWLIINYNVLFIFLRSVQQKQQENNQLNLEECKNILPCHLDHNLVLRTTGVNVQWTKSGEVDHQQTQLQHNLVRVSCEVTQTEPKEETLERRVWREQRHSTEKGSVWSAGVTLPMWPFQMIDKLKSRQIYLFFWRLLTTRAHKQRMRMRMRRRKVSTQTEMLVLNNEWVVYCLKGWVNTHTNTHTPLLFLV